ncbi:MAG TPA: hypothetical protein VEK57_26325 [Thermoanaerobaculia bacterium]|nr:hypothetical protein [Thermoanaerobaculia bacterium]
MKTIALWLNIALFAALSAVSWLDPEMDVTPAELVLDIALSVFTVLGMVFYATRIAVPQLVAAWKAIAPLLLAGYIVRLALGWPELMVQDSDSTVTEHRIVVCIALAAAAVALVPAIVINFRFARARHLRNHQATAA